MSNTFAVYHPAVTFLYFTAVILLTMFLMNPLLLFISFAAAFAYSFLLKGRKAAGFSIKFCLPAALAIAVVNPLFVHRGKTALLLLTGVPVTLESLCYGCSAALMLVSVLLWFSCSNEIMTSDKFIYLFGKAAPAISLLISMTLRLVFNLKRQVTRILGAQRTLGMDISRAGILRRAAQGMRIFSVLMTWALESSVGTADSMRARGFGLRGRTSFSIFSFDRKDAVFLCFFGASVMFCVRGIASGAASFQYYPDLKWPPASGAFWPMVISYIFICFLPLMVEIADMTRWRLRGAR